MTSAAESNEPQRYDLLILTATETEQQQLIRAAKELAIEPTPRAGKFSREFYDFGELGSYRVAAIRSRVGALDYGGSASAAQVYRAETFATGIIAVGMAFGISRKQQAIGDVLVSEGLFPYDDRIVVTVAGKPEYRYQEIEMATNTVSEPQDTRVKEYARFRRAKPSFVKFFRRHAQRVDKLSYKVHVGALLSGGARVRSAVYRDTLYGHFVGRGKAIVGGEMEAVGLLSCSNPTDPWWIVVKGICDFADEDRDDDITCDREPACYNAARFVLASLQQSKATDNL